MADVFIGLGSNLGDRRHYIHRAVDLLNQYKICVNKLSSIIETEPVGGPPQDKFLNAVLHAKTTHTPYELLNILQKIEKELGRQKTVINGPRTIDLDILLYDDIVMKEETLTIPHPRMLEREFVLKPLKEIAPELSNKLTYANN